MEQLGRVSLPGKQQFGSTNLAGLQFEPTSNGIISFAIKIDLLARARTRREGKRQHSLNREEGQLIFERYGEGLWRRQQRYLAGSGRPNSQRP
jgi:hypothetical protein